MNHVAKDILMHYGMPRRSGRYPWGSGENPYQHSKDFLGRVNELKKQGLSEAEIAAELGILNEHGKPSSSRLRVQVQLANHERRALDVATARRLRDKEGLTLKEIADKMGYKNDSSVRSLLNENSEARMNQARKTADFLKEQVDKKGMIDVGTGVERELGISKEKLKEALYILELEGYPNYGGGVAQITNKGKQTNQKILCPPGTEHKEIYDFNNVHTVNDYISYDGGETFKKSFVYPASMDSKRIKIRYAEDGGIHKDGVIELRRGVEDLSLGNSHYAQVRILVDGTHYLKGMAIYNDNMPDGADIVFNTNKKKGTPMEKVLKPITGDPENPFGALIKEHGGQSYYIDKNGKEKLSLINKAREEGDWREWSDKLPAQFLSKQSLPLIKKQLNLSVTDKVNEFDEIKSLTNPTVKRALLDSFANDCDTAAVHLQAAALPRQKYQVILPLTSIKDNEVYAPNYNHGETVALIRFPHGGTFEIPILTVNNKQEEGKRVLGNTPLDAVGINSKVAERLSGADFDGDTVMVIPCNSSRSKVHITSRPPLKDLEGFDAKLEYAEREGMRYMRRTGPTGKTIDNTQIEMGKISNLITDMTIKGATADELAKAVKHSMVVIDAGKHKLDYKRSETENEIAALKKKYQGHYDEEGKYHEGGASTLISRAKAEKSVPKRQGQPIVNEDGSLSYKTADPDKLYYIDKKTGKRVMRTQQSTQMAETNDARTLSTGHAVEEYYADYANKMKALANEARKEKMAAGKLVYSASANKAYQEEVKSLQAKLNIALLNAPKERDAQRRANAVVAKKKENDPDLASNKKELKKVSQQALTAERQAVGAKRQPVVVTDREWQAIQAGAISDSVLSKIIANADIDSLRQRATPRASTTLSQAKINQITSMRLSGYTTAEIAQRLGVSTSTVSKYLNS